MKQKVVNFGYFLKKTMKGKNSLLNTLTQTTPEPTTHIYISTFFFFILLLFLFYFFQKKKNSALTFFFFFITFFSFSQEVRFLRFHPHHHLLPHHPLLHFLHHHFLDHCFCHCHFPILHSLLLSSPQRHYISFAL